MCKLELNAGAPIRAFGVNRDRDRSRETIFYNSIINEPLIKQKITVGILHGSEVWHCRECCFNFRNGSFARKPCLRRACRSRQGAMVEDAEYGVILVENKHGFDGGDTDGCKSPQLSICRACLYRERVRSEKNRTF